jgi:D-alanine-D-alanine ligase
MTIPAADKARLRILFLAKHANSGGRPSPVDGNHAAYHHELLTTMRAIGLNVETADSFDPLFTSQHADWPRADYIVTLLNRAGFLNSEMMGPLLATRSGIPFLGASPILRGLADDKHLSRMAAVASGVPVARGILLRRGGLATSPRFSARRLIVKPNASSASWGVRIVEDWSSAYRHADVLHAQGHDALIEEWLPRHDVVVPVIGGPGGQPQILPALQFSNHDPLSFRSYEEKRGLVPVECADDLQAITDRTVVRRLKRYVDRMLPEFWPFDYGRFEFRYDASTGRIAFMEINVSCNLWSRKSVSRAAALAGLDHAALVETILAHGLERQGLIAAQPLEVAA